MSGGENVRPDRGGFTLRTELPAQPVERPVLGEFVELVVRVPIDRSGAAQAVWGVPGDYTHEQIAAMLREQYPSPAGFLADWWPECAQVAVRIRARQGQDMLRDEFVNIWGDASGTGTAQ